jgi:nicotinamidase-related amidase
MAAANGVVMVVDMQNGVFATPRIEREAAAQINRLMRAADTVIFIQHAKRRSGRGSEGFALFA